MSNPTPALRPPGPETTHQQRHAWLTWLDNHRLTPAAAHALAHDARVPAEIRAHLQAARAQARAHWLLRKTALLHLLSLSAQEPAQPLILLKGAALALNLYPDPTLRPMNDIDLLISPAAMPDMLRRMRAHYQERGLSTGNDVGYLHHFIFTHPATGMQLELHKTLPLLPDNNRGLDWFLNQTEPHHLQGLPYLTFTPEAQILHLAAHAILEHGGQQGALGIWLYDIDQILRQWGNTLDWEQTLAQARHLHWEAALHQAIHLARQHFASPTPAALQTWIQLPQNQLSGYNILRSMTAANRSSSRTIFHILRGLSWQQRIQQLTHMFFPSRTYMQRRYPQLPWPLTYPYRWFDAARKLLRR
jgi:hypothetical protein